MTPINLLHNPLCPADSICNGSYGCRNPRSAVVLRQFSCRKNACGDQQHALATLVHFRNLPYWFEIGEEPEDSWEKEQARSEKSSEAEKASQVTASVPETAKEPAEPTSR